MVGEEIGHEPDFLLMLLGGGDAAEVGKVLLVHAEDEIESVEVEGGDLAGAVGEIVAVAAAASPHSGIGEAADVPRADGGGVDLDIEIGIEGELADDTVGGRGAADVSEADEKQGCFVLRHRDRDLW